VVIVMYMRPAVAEDAHHGIAVTPANRFTIGFAAVAVLLLFFAPGWVLGVAQQSVASLFAMPGAFFGMHP
jgi:hypothetical protein